MKKQFSIIAALVAVLMVGIMLTSFTSSRSESDTSSSESGYLMVRTIETTGWGSTIIVVHEDGTSETFSMLKYQRDNLTENVVLIQKKLEEIRKQGYSLVSFVGGCSDNSIVNSYLFQKK